MDAITYGDGIGRLLATLKDHWPECQIDFDWGTINGERERLMNIRTLDGKNLTGIGTFRISADGKPVAIAQLFIHKY